MNQQRAIGSSADITATKAVGRCASAATGHVGGMRASALHERKHDTVTVAANELHTCTCNM